MAFESDWSELFNRSITVEPWQSEDSGGKPTFGSGVAYECFIRDDVKVWKWEDGNEQQSRRTIYVNGLAIGRKDRITLPAGYDPRIVFPVYLIRRDDETAYHHTELYI